MLITITDGYTLNPGDLSWESIAKYGDIALYDRSAEVSLAERCKDAAIILTNKTPISADIIGQAKNLKLICVTATGYNIVDVEAARKRNVTVCNVPNYGTSSVSQHTFALILELANRVGANGASVLNGDWVRSPDFCYSKGNITELSGKTLGIIGFGKIGQQVARLANAFEMKVVYYSRSKKDVDHVQYVELENLFSRSDIITLHCPLTKENLKFINKEVLQLIKNSAWLINTSRGQLINEPDLAEALNSGKIAAAALDVLSVEPPDESNPLLRAKNCLITPHTAWMSIEARTRILETTERNIKQFLEGTPQNVV